MADDYLRGREVGDRAAWLEALFAADVVGMVVGEGDMVTEANDEFLRTVGQPRQALATGLSWRQITPADQLERDAAALSAVSRDGASLLVKSFARPDGDEVRVLAAVVATGWKPYRWIAVVVDVSRDERLRQFAQSEAAIVSTLLEDAPIAFALIDTQMRFVRVNRELAAMNGQSVVEHEGRPVFDVVPALRGSAEHLLQRVLTTGEPLRDVEIVGMTAADPGVEHTWLESFFPVRLPHGPVVGVALVARDETLLRRLQRDLRATNDQLHDALAQMQASLLPQSLPSPPGVDIDAVYESAAQPVGLGGDWYDVVHAPHGRLVVCVGDVVGHGLPAVGMMARTSAALRAYVSEGHPPAVVLRLINTLLCTDGSDGLATAVLVLLDPVTGEVEYACAGHPYPLMRRSAGQVHVLDGAQGPLLGAVPESVYHSATANLEPGGSLLLYTDGLIERRDEAISAGGRRLSAALSTATAGASASELIHTALQACATGRQRDDDLCVVAVQRTRGVSREPSPRPSPGRAGPRG